MVKLARPQRKRKQVRGLNRTIEVMNHGLRVCREYRHDFFFQAEDGIRDLTVTGVQTCALPISISAPMPDCWYVRYSSVATDALPAYAMPIQPKLPSSSVSVRRSLRFSLGTRVTSKIGRASCRERV